MRKYQLYLATILTAFTMIFTSCSNDYMENMNTDPSKASTIDPNAQLTTGELQTYGDLGMVELYRNYLYAFDQQLMGCWNTTNFGGRHTVDNSEMSRIWTSFYPSAIKNITDAEYRTEKDEHKVNVNSALRIYRVYLMSIITDIYGDVPYSEAGKGFISGISNPKYDTQESIYNDFFLELDSAASKFDATKDKITGDVIYNGDVNKWKKLANSLRLRFAMRISKVNPEKAQKEFENALQADGGIMSSSSDDALIKYMAISFSFGQEAYTDYRGNAMSQLLFGNDPANNPSYLCSTLFNKLYNTGDPRTFMIARCYYDGLMSSTSPDNRVDLTDEMISKNIAFKPRDPGAFSWDPWPSGYDSDILKELSKTNPSVSSSVAREVEPKLANNFLKGNNPGVVMTSSEVKFLLAEAKLNGWNVGGVTADDMYRQGVRAAMDFLTNNYGCAQVSDDAFNTYMTNNGIGHTDDQKRESINTQAWILHLTNPAECWSNVRRSGYPKLKSPNDYGFGQYLTGGVDIPVRLCYPVLESSYNKSGYDDALSRMGGKDDWHTNVWWDK
ncbi:MAG TPA: SusD/RagB family nutrient-binding outer membrane lipoprotein [Xylanibacter oryzae]|uniref:SusD/RagB family nutrient-binding outer membrane lipoprotein n=1 Tax=Xylanibacter oryzae TaxID=185293 RepID=UPI00055A9DEC|nr:SusD/RagB family nutrient-binding outer membrane lipoprotein [Xylanibacter oryzae]HRN15643.1 SusD/RagB family nutrient-binding outer membrane lipoprotein [Xylanibacter oryzae]